MNDYCEVVTYVKCFSDIQLVIIDCSHLQCLNNNCFYHLATNVDRLHKDLAPTTILVDLWLTSLSFSI